MRWKTDWRTRVRRCATRVRKEDGAELVEFAAASTVLFALLFGIMEFSLSMYSGSFVAYAAHQGARYAQVRGADWASACATTASYGCQASTTDIQNYILGLPHPGINLAASDITVTALTTTATGSACTANTQGCQIKVQVSYTFPLAIPFFSHSLPFASTAIETIQD